MHRRRITIWAGVALAVVVAAVAVGWWRSGVGGVERVSGPVSSATRGVQLESTTWTPDGVDRAHPAPAVLVVHGLGEDEDDVAGLVRSLVREGYVVQSWTSRGGSGSDGRVGVAAADGEVADVSALVDELARRDDVVRDGAGDPRVAVVGVSHGGGVALLASAPTCSASAWAASCSRRRSVAPSVAPRCPRSAGS